MWMNFEDRMLSAISRIQKGRNYMIPPVGDPANNQIHRDRESKGGCHMEGGKSYCFLGTGFLFGKMKDLEVDGGYGVQQCECI